MLQRIDVNEENENYASVDGVLYDKDKKILIACPKKIQVLDIPEGVTTICGMINGDDIKTIKIPKSLKEIFLYGLDKEFPIFAKNIENIEINEQNESFVFEDGTLYDKEKTKLMYCTKKIQVLDIPEGVTTIFFDALDGCNQLTKIRIPDSVTDIPENTFSGGLNSLNSIEVSEKKKHIIYEKIISLAKMYSNEQKENIIGDTYRTLNKIKNMETYKIINKNENQSNDDIFLYRMVNSIGADEAQRLFLLPNVNEKDIKRLLKEKEEAYSNLYDTKYQIEGDFGVAIEILKEIGRYSKENNKGEKNSLEQIILKAINESLENGYKGKLSRLIKEKLAEKVDDKFIEQIEEKENRINRHLIEKRLEQEDKELLEAISQTSEEYPDTIAEMQIQGISVKVKNAIKTSFIEKGRIDTGNIKEILEDELTNSSPYISQNKEQIIYNIMKLINEEEFSEKLKGNALEAFNNVKEQIGNKWRYRLGVELGKIGYSIESVPNELTLEEIEKLKNGLHIKGEIEKKPKAILKQGKSLEEAYKLLQEIEAQGIITWQQIHDMFGSVHEPYSKKFQEFYKQNRDEILNNPEIYQKFGVIQNNFEDIIKSKELRNVYKKGKLTINQILEYLESKEYENQRLGDEELARYGRMFEIVNEKEFADAQKIFDIVRKRERTSVPPMKVTKKKFRGRMLSPDDILNMFAGNITTCCQRFKDVGEGSMLLGSIEENAGIFVVEELDENGETLGIIGQSLTFRQKGVEGHYDRLTFDNIEIANGVKDELTKEDSQEILSIYQEAAEQAMKLDEKFLKKQLEDGKISEKQYESLRLKEVIAGVGYNDLEGLEQLENAEEVVPEDAYRVYQGMNGRRGNPWIDSTYGEVPHGSKDGYPVILARREERGKASKATNLNEVPLWYGKVGKVQTKGKYEITEDEIEIMKKVERAVYRYEQQLMNYEQVETEEDLEYCYNIENPVVKIGSNNDWYMIYGENEDDIMISDFAVYGMMSAEKNETIDGANSKLAMAESSFETYKLLIESALNGKRIYCNATQDTSYQNIKRMMEKGLAQVKDFNEENIMLKDGKMVYEDTGEEVRGEEWSDESEMEMIDLEIIPNVEKLEKEIKKIENLLEVVQQQQRMIGSKKETGLDDLRRKIRDER